jgi:hypothetical protein
MRYHRSKEYKHADSRKFGQFIGLKSAKWDDDRSFSIDERDARMIVANLRKREYENFKKEYPTRPVSPFRLLQDFEYRRKRK